MFELLHLQKPDHCLHWCLAFTVPLAILTMTDAWQTRESTQSAGFAICQSQVTQSPKGTKLKGRVLIPQSLYNHDPQIARLPEDGRCQAEVREAGRLQHVQQLIRASVLTNALLWKQQESTLAMGHMRVHASSTFPTRLG